MKPIELDYDKKLFTHNFIPQFVLICKATWLPSFKTKKEFDDFHGSANGTQISVLTTFHCKACDCYHAQTMSKGPGANSASGVDRVSKLSKQDMAKIERKYKRFWK